MGLKQAIPWGRNSDEYCEMFGLSWMQPGDRILGCGDGPAAFNKEATARGIRVTSVDPLCAFERDDLERSVEQALDEVMPKLAERLEDYVWRTELGGIGVGPRGLFLLQRIENLRALRRQCDRYCPLTQWVLLIDVIPAAICLDHWASSGAFDTTFYLVQRVELLFGAVNLTLM